MFPMQFIATVISWFIEWLLFAKVFVLGILSATYTSEIYRAIKNLFRELNEAQWLNIVLRSLVAATGYGSFKKISSTFIYV